MRVDGDDDMVERYDDMIEWGGNITPMIEWGGDHSL